MNVISIIIKEIKHNLRNRKSLIMMILLPIVLILVLGTALKSVFGTSINIGTPKVLYIIENNGVAADNFKTNFIDKGKDYNINFLKTKDIESAKKKLITTDEYACIVQMKDDSKIIVYNNNKSNLQGGIVDSIISIYAQKYNAIAEIQKINPRSLTNILSDNNADYTSISSVNKINKPSSLNYYTIAEMALIIMYGSSAGLYGIAREKNSKTRDRILSGPVRKSEFLVGKTIGGVLVTVLQILIVILFSKYVLKADFGSDIFTVMAIFTSQIIMAVSMGVGLGFIFKNENIASGILNFLIPVIVFLGGSYSPVDHMGSKLFTDVITYLSPVRWVNQSIFGVIYSGDYSKVIPTIMINIGIGLIFLASASLIFRRESV